MGESWASSVALCAAIIMPSRDRLKVFPSNLTTAVLVMMVEDERFTIDIVLDHGIGYGSHSVVYSVRDKWSSVSEVPF